MKPAEQQKRTLIEVRGPSGRFYGWLDPKRLILEVKRKGEKPEQIDLTQLIAAAK